MASAYEQKKPDLQFTGDLVPYLVDKRAGLTPDAIYSECPFSALTYDEGYHYITYRDFANGVEGADRWLQNCKFRARTLRLWHFILDGANRKLIANSVNFYTLGMDSLKAVALV